MGGVHTNCGRYKANHNALGNIWIIGFLYVSTNLYFYDPVLCNPSVPRKSTCFFFFLSFIVLLDVVPPFSLSIILSPTKHLPLLDPFLNSVFAFQTHLHAFEWKIQHFRRKGLAVSE